MSAVPGLRVLHLLDHSLPLQSGYTFRTRSIIDGERALGFETRHLTGCKQGAPQASLESADGLDFYRTAGADSWTARAPVLGQFAITRKMRRRVREVLREWPPDVLHAHSPCLDGLAALSLGLPLVYEVRAFWEDAAVDHGTAREGNLRYRLTRALETRVLKRADAVTTICEGLRSDILGRGIAPARVTVVPNCVHVKSFQWIERRDSELEAQLDLRGRLVLGFIGSFYAYEGLDLLLAAMAQIRVVEPRACLLLAGGGYEEKNLRALAERHGIQNDCRFVGRVPHAAVSRYYSLLDACVFPRKSMRLTELVTPLKPLEAMAQGVPVLASDVGGHRELVRDGVTGELFPAGDADALVESVLAWARRPDRRSLVDAARRYVERERDWATVVERYRQVYADARARHGEENRA